MVNVSLDLQVAVSGRRLFELPVVFLVNCITHIVAESFFDSTEYILTLSLFFVLSYFLAGLVVRSSCINLKVECF